MAKVIEALTLQKNIRWIPPETALMGLQATVQ